MMMLKRVLRWTRTTWHALQVELHGHYSHAQLQRFEEYQATTTLWRVACVCVLTPVPTVIMIIGIGVLRLEPIESGAFHSPNMWLRQWFTVALMSLSVLQQLAQHLPEFEINLVDCAIISILSSACNVGSVLALSTVIGYPLPFSVVLGSVPWYFVFIVIFAVRKRHHLRHSPDSMARMKRYILVSMCQLTMTMIYPVYSYFYKRISSLQQTAFVLILPLIKISMKNWICHTLPDTDDAKPEAIVFNVEVFHSLFVSLCMGNTTSTRTIVALMAVDVVEMWISFHDIQHILNGLQPVANKLMLPKEVRMDKYPSLAVLTSDHVGEQACMVVTRPSRTATWWERIQTCVQSDSRIVGISAKALRTGRVAPEPMTATNTAAQLIVRPAEAVNATLTDTTACTNVRKELLLSARTLLTSSERLYLVATTEKLLFVTEFVVLVEYTEVIVPTVYIILLWAFDSLPNREFYTFLDGVCTPTNLLKIITNVQLYSVLEMLSLLAIAFGLWKKLGLSVIHQLAFVLEDRAANIQSKLLLWILYILQISMVQNGSDYSFQFKWLHQASNASLYAFTNPCGNSTST